MITTKSILIILALSLVSLYCVLSLALPRGEGYLLHAIVAISSLSILIQVRLNDDANFLRPMNLVYFIFCLQLASGLTNYAASVWVFPHFYVDVLYPTFIWVSFIVCFQLGLLTWKYLLGGAKRAQGSPKSYHFENSNLLVLFSGPFFVASLIGLVIIVRHYGTIPFMLGADLDKARFIMHEEISPFISGRLAYSYVIGLWLIISWLFIKGYTGKRVFFALALLVVPLSQFYGDRVPLFLILIYTSLYFGKTRKITTKHFATAAIISVACLGLWAGVNLLRGSIYNTPSVVWYEVVGLSFGTGFRDFCGIYELFYGATEATNFLKEFLVLIPRPVLALFGVDIYALISEHLPALIAREFGHYSGVRVGIIGEIYLYMGFWGFFLMLGLGVLFGFLDAVYWHRLNIEDPLFILMCALLTVLILVPEESVSNVLSYLKAFFYPVIPIALFRKRRTQKLEYAARRPVEEMGGELVGHRSYG